jgi:hypothetical protein
MFSPDVSYRKTKKEDKEIALSKFRTSPPVVKVVWFGYTVQLSSGGGGGGG